MDSDSENNSIKKRLITPSRSSTNLAFDKTPQKEDSNDFSMKQH